MTAALFWTALLAFVGSAVACALLLRFALRLPQDRPNARSLHELPMPRVGGLALWFGVLAALAVAPGATLPLRLWCAPWAVLLLVSLADDVRHLAVALRLVAHAAAAVWMAVALLLPEGFAAPVAWAPVLFAALTIAWSLNLYNFMDGSDGLALLMTVTGFGAYAAGAALGGIAAPWTALAVAAAAAGVLLFNHPPARLFIGDAGSVPLGFLAGTLGLAGVVKGWWPPWFPLLAFLPFIADASVTLLLRALRRERLTQAHRSHYYQRLHRLGAGHRGTLAIYGAWMAGTAVTAVLCLGWAQALGPYALAAWCMVTLLLFVAIDYHWRKRSPSLP